MNDYSSLSTRWDCKYHIVFVPKYRRKVICGKFRKDIRGHAMPNHIYILVKIPPRFFISNLWDI